MQKVILKRLPDLSYASNEAINTLYTNLTFLGDDTRTIMFTSCHEGEGKTFISMRTALTMAKMGKRVVLVDCDLRKSQICANYLNMDYGSFKGTSHYLAGMASVEDVLYATSEHNFFIVPCTKTVNNSLALFTTSRFQELLDVLSPQVDYIIVDSPPVGLLVDAAQIATSCDGTVVVVGYNSVHRRELLDALHQLEQSHCPILGTVLNKVDVKNYAGRKYYYSKYSSGYYGDNQGK